MVGLCPAWPSGWGTTEIIIQPAIQFLTTCTPALGTISEILVGSWKSNLQNYMLQPQSSDKQNFSELDLNENHFHLGESKGWGEYILKLRSNPLVTEVGWKGPAGCVVYGLTLLWCHWPEGYYRNQSNFYVQDSKAAWSSEQACPFLMKNLHQDWIWSEGKLGKVVERWHKKIIHLFTHLTALNKI